MPEEEEGFGPGFQPATSRLYKAEYAAGSLLVLGFLAWKALYGGVDVVQTVLWAVLPDVVAFAPIGLASRGRGVRTWPAWGATLYDVAHTLLLPGTLLFVLTFALRTNYLPLLGWVLHITADRALGFGLRRRGEQG